VQGPPTIETRRLLLRSPRAADVDALFEIQGDPEAMRFTYCAATREDTARHLEAHAARFAEDGFAPWTLVCRTDERIVGWGGLHRDPKAPHWGTEVSYFFHPHCWGRGFATELVTTSLQHAFRELGLSEVDAFTQPANRASARALQKAGFSRLDDVPELARDRFRAFAKPQSAGGVPGAGPLRAP
jgi:ribosomal-protein-alanine N-acetyltransferase